MNKIARGFTLIELMIVVAIIGILAAVAIPNFLKYQLKSRRTEGSVNVAAIRTAQIAHFGSHDSFVTADINPTNPAKGQKGSWERDANSMWKQLGYEPEGDVYYQYRTEAEEGAFLVEAFTDLDKNGINSCWVFGKPMVDEDGSFKFGDLEVTDGDDGCPSGKEPDPKDPQQTRDIELTNHYNKVFLHSGEDNY